MKTFNDIAMTNVRQIKYDGAAFTAQGLSSESVFLASSLPEKAAPDFSACSRLLRGRVARPGFELRHREVIEESWRLRGLVDRFLQGARGSGIVPRA